MSEKRVPHQGSYIRTDTFVNEEFKYGAQNNLRNYLEFEDADELAQKMDKLFEQLDEEQNE